MLTSLLAIEVIMALSSNAKTPSPGSPPGLPTAHPIFTIDRQAIPHIEAVEYTLKDRARNIFAVPERNAVGTNSYNDAITVLDLSGVKVRYREVKRGFVDYPLSSGEMVFLPEFSKDTIGYSQTRGFMLFNVKTGQFRDPIITRHLAGDIQDVAVIDWERRLFLFNLSFVPDFNRGFAVLKLVDLSSAEPKEIASFKILRGLLTPKLGRVTLGFDDSSGRSVYYALDDHLRPIEHPLLAALNSPPVPGIPDLPVVHPQLPFAVFSTYQQGAAASIVLWVAAWGSSTSAPTVFRLSENKMAQWNFSPDGKWLLLQDGTNGPDRLVVMPVDPALPHFLGPPVLLQTAEKIPESWNGKCAWISDPLSVVCAVNRTEYIETTGEEREINKLLKWEISPGNIKK